MATWSRSLTLGARVRPSTTRRGSARTPTAATTSRSATASSTSTSPSTTASTTTCRADGANSLPAPGVRSRERKRPVSPSFPPTRTPPDRDKLHEHGPGEQGLSTPPPPRPQHGHRGGDTAERPHHERRPGAQLGAAVIALARDVRARLLRDGDDRHGDPAVRPRALRRRDLSRQPPPGGPAHRPRHRDLEDGPRGPAHLA